MEFAVVTAEGEESKKEGPTRGRSWGGASGFGPRDTGGRTRSRDGGKRERTSVCVCVYIYIYIYVCVTCGGGLGVGCSQVSVALESLRLWRSSG